MCLEFHPPVVCLSIQWRGGVESILTVTVMPVSVVSITSCSGKYFLFLDSEI